MLFFFRFFLHPSNPCLRCHQLSLFFSIPRFDERTVIAWQDKQQAIHIVRDGYPFLRFIIDPRVVAERLLSSQEKSINQLETNAFSRFSSTPMKNERIMQSLKSSAITFLEQAFYIRFYFLTLCRSCQPTGISALPLNRKHRALTSPKWKNDINKTIDFAFDISGQQLNSISICWMMQFNVDALLKWNYVKWTRVNDNSHTRNQTFKSFGPVADWLNWRPHSHWKSLSPLVNACVCVLCVLGECWQVSSW